MKTRTNMMAKEHLDRFNHRWQPFSATDLDFSFHQEDTQKLGSPTPQGWQQQWQPQESTHARERTIHILSPRHIRFNGASSTQVTLPCDYWRCQSSSRPLFSISNLARYAAMIHRHLYRLAPSSSTWKSLGNNFPHSTYWAHPLPQPSRLSQLHLFIESYPPAQPRAHFTRPLRTRQTHRTPSTTVACSKVGAEEASQA